MDLSPPWRGIINYLAKIGMEPRNPLAFISLPCSKRFHDLFWKSFAEVISNGGLFSHVLLCFVAQCGLF